MPEDGEKPRDRRWRHRASGGGCSGCGGFLIVLTLGILLALLHVQLGLTLSLRVPFTSSNVTAAAAIGGKEHMTEALAPYVRDRVGGNQNLINASQTMTVGPAEGAAMLVLGRQPGAPVVDIALLVK